MLTALCDASVGRVAFKACQADPPIGLSLGMDLLIPPVLSAPKDSLPSNTMFFRYRHRGPTINGSMAFLASGSRSHSQSPNRERQYILIFTF